MKRAYLEEDVELIQKYFPGAKTVALRTPFGRMHSRRRAPRLERDSFNDATNPHPNWTRNASWNN